MISLANFLLSGSINSALVCNPDECLSYIIVFLNLLTIFYLVYSSYKKVNKITRIFGYIWSCLIMVASVVVLAIHTCIFTIAGTIFSGMAIIAVLSMIFESKKAENVNAKNVKTENVKAENSNVCDINIERLTGLSHLSRGEVILRAIEKACGRRKDITREHIASVEALASNISGSRVDLPYGLVAERVYDRIVVYDASSVDSMDGVSGKLRLDTFPYENGMIISKNEYTKMIDCDRIKSVPVLRTPEEGDFIVINKDGGRKKLSRFLTDCKVERMKRAIIPVVADGNEIIWVVGHRLSERYKITENTKTVMELSFDKEDRT